MILWPVIISPTHLNNVEKTCPNDTHANLASARETKPIYEAESALEPKPLKPPKMGRVNSAHLVLAI